MLTRVLSGNYCISHFDLMDPLFLYKTSVPEITGSHVGLTCHKKMQAFCCFDPMTVVMIEEVKGGGGV